MLDDRVLGYKAVERCNAVEYEAKSYERDALVKKRAVAQTSVWNIVTDTKNRTDPYAIVTAPSSDACLRVLYPLFPFGPLRRTKNFSGRFRCDMNGSRDMGGRRTSETREFTTPVKEVAIL